MLHRFPFCVSNHWEAGFRAGLAVAALLDLAGFLVFVALVVIR